ncbi:PilZ domain-containing protein [Psychromonas sp.]|nr:PilZ domain-containing protein [Psychromonas sp.]
MYFSKNNQRSFQRMELNLPIVISKEAQVYNGTCLDLSSTGMRIEFTTLELKTGDIIYIQLDTNDERFPPLDAEAKLIRVNTDEEGKLTAAVEFIALK